MIYFNSLSSFTYKGITICFCSKMVPRLSGVYWFEIFLIIGYLEDGRKRWAHCLATEITRYNLIRFLCGNMKYRVFSRKIRNLQHLRNRIMDTSATVTSEMLQNTWVEIEHQLDILYATNRSHLEMY